MTTDLAPITDGLFTWPSDAPQLIGSKCDNCGTVAFPAQGSCARCTSTDVSEHLLAREGTLWTWTVQGFRPKSPPYDGPAEFVPFPPLRYGWGLDVHWSALARERGWRLGVVDALPVRHDAVPVASGYSREAAAAEAREFLRDRPYVPAAEAQRTLAAHTDLPR